MVLTNLLEAGHRVGEHEVQCGVVFHQRMVLIVPNELHYRGEREGVREAVLPITVVNLDQLVVPFFPEKVKWQRTKLDLQCQIKCKPCFDIICDGSAMGTIIFSFLSAYLNVSVKSPCSLVDASRTRKEPSGVSRSFSFTSSLRVNQ